VIAVSSCPKLLLIWIFLNLRTPSSSTNDPQMSCWEHDLPLVPDSIPTISTVIPEGWWLQKFMLQVFRIPSKKLYHRHGLNYAIYGSSLLPSASERFTGVVVGSLQLRGRLRCCHGAVAPLFNKTMERTTRSFQDTEFFLVRSIRTMQFHVRDVWMCNCLPAVLHSATTDGGTQNRPASAVARSVASK
jgi:hypothetical protein